MVGRVEPQTGRDDLGSCVRRDGDLVCPGMEAAIVEKEALQLSDCERAVLADRLLESLSRRPAGLESVWLREADDRMMAFRSGKIEAVSGPEALAELRREFRR